MGRQKNANGESYGTAASVIDLSARSLPVCLSVVGADKKADQTEPTGERETGPADAKRDGHHKKRTRVSPVSAALGWVTCDEAGGRDIQCETAIRR